MLESPAMYKDEVVVQTHNVRLPGELVIPDAAHGLVVFAHGSGSSRLSTRNRQVAEDLNIGGLGTLLFDLLTAEEHEVDQRTSHLRFDIGLLANRLIDAVEWAAAQPAAASLPIGLFGASTGAAAALICAAHRPQRVRAVVSRGGRPDLAGDALSEVKAPTLLIVGGADEAVIEMNYEASRALGGEYHIDVIPGAGHLFEEPGALEQVALLARDWFNTHLPDGKAPAR